VKSTPSRTHEPNYSRPPTSMRPNPSLHLTFASRLRRLSPAGQLKRLVFRDASIRMKRLITLAIVVLIPR
jgi:hypothetical protein